MQIWSESVRTGRFAGLFTAALAAGVWFCPAFVSPSMAAEAQEFEIARTSDPIEEQRTRADNPWNISPETIEAPGIDPKTGLRSESAGGIPVQPNDDELAAKLVEWVLLRDNGEEQTFEEITDFIKANPDWPRLSAIRNKAERAIDFENNDKSLLAWFEAYPPRTIEGATAYAEALYRGGLRDEAAEVAQRAWIRFNMKQSDERAFLARFKGYLEAAHHQARLDRLLWDNRRTAARRQMKRVDKGYRALAEARILMLQRKRTAGKALKKVPESLAGNQGLVYEWVRWNRRREKDTVAIEALLAFGGEMTHQKRWWTERQLLARRALGNDDPATAYRLVKDHGLKNGVEFAEAEFMAGWIALRFLDMPHPAFEHFSNLYKNVRTPISLSRAAYWAGRAAEAAGDGDIARQWFRTAARGHMAFYGQLAGQRIGIATDPEPPREPEIMPGAVDSFERDQMVRAIRLLASLRAAQADAKKASRKEKIDPAGDPTGFLAQLDDSKALVPFLRHVARRAATVEDWILTARLARDSGRIDIAVYIARRAARDGVVLSELGYPTIVLVQDIAPGPALLHALIRQESAFDVEAHSRAGARGLMQLMPATARTVARRLKVKGHSTARLTSDPYHNLVLGGAYLESMLTRYEGSMIMAVAAYNAGPHRVDKWIIDNGDPRGTLDDAIDWIESIPFSETRNYVQRVMEALPIYRQKLDGAQIAALRDEDIAGQLPGYEAPN